MNVNGYVGSLDGGESAILPRSRMTIGDRVLCVGGLPTTDIMSCNYNAAGIIECATWFGFATGAIGQSIRG